MSDSMSIGEDEIGSNLEARERFDHEGGLTYEEITRHVWKWRNPFNNGGVEKFHLRYLKYRSACTCSSALVAYVHPADDSDVFS